MEKNSIRHAVRLRLSRSLLTLVYLALSFAMLLPFIWMVSTAFKPDDQVLTVIPQLIPKKFTIQAFVLAWTNVDFPHLYANSLIIAVISTIATLAVCSTAGFAFAKYQFRLKEICFVLILCTMMIPFQVTMIPLYLIVSKLHWQNTYQGVLFPQLASAFGVFLMRQFMETVPTELMEAARIDGASEFKIFRRIMLPLIKPVIATLGLFTFMWSWDSFLWPLIVIDSAAKRTVPLGIAMVTQMAGQRVLYNQLMAISIFGMVPVLIVFMLLQRHFVQGVVMSGLKG